MEPMDTAAKSDHCCTSTIAAGHHLKIKIIIINIRLLFLHIKSILLILWGLGGFVLTNLFSDPELALSNTAPAPQANFHLAPLVLPVGSAACIIQGV